MKSIATLLTLAAALPALATNGMNLLGYGAESALMAGGRLFSQGPAALMGNPALLAEVEQPVLAGSLSLLMPQLTYTDAANPGGVDGEPSVFPLPFVGYAKPLGGRLVAGLSAYAQGGMGVDFKDLNTVFGTQDKLYSNVAYLRLTGGAAVKTGNRSAVGLSLSVGYAMLDFDFFPSTVVDMNGDMQPEFNGMSVQGLTSVGANARLGFSSHALQDRLTWGAWFGTKANMRFEGGTLTFAAPLPDGSNDFAVQFKAFAWPAEIGAGFSYQPTKRVTLVADLVHYGWRDAVDLPYLQTDVAMINAMLPPFHMHWQDRTAASVGGRVQVLDNLAVLAGFNHAASPVPDASLNGLFPATVEDHFTLGLAGRLGSWDLQGGVELAPKVSQTNPDAADDPSDYFGMTRTTIDHNQLSLHLGFRKAL